MRWKRRAASGRLLPARRRAGVGKSTLTQALGADVSGRGCVFAYGRCRDGAPAPYSALSDALSAILRGMRATGPAERDRWRADIVREMSGFAGILAELVPELAPLLGEPSAVADLDAADSRRQLHRAVIRLLCATSEYRTVVLAVDDLQWADRDTLLLLGELLTVSLRNVLVLGAYRTGEFDPVAAGITSENLTTLHLEPLAPTLSRSCWQTSAAGAWNWAMSRPSSTTARAATRCSSVSCSTAPSAKARSSGSVRVVMRVGTCGCSRRSRCPPRPRSSWGATSTSCAPPTGTC